MRSFSHRSSGFTLIELLIVIGIVSVLASVTVIALKPAKHFRDTQDARRRHTETQVGNAVYQYIIREGDLPDAAIPEGEQSAKYICVPTLSSTDCHAANGVDFSVLTPDYIQTIERDPAEACTTLTGYKVALVQGRPQVYAVHEGLLPGEGQVALQCPEPELSQDMLASWRLNDPSGSTTASDSSGNGHQATLTGFSATTDWVTSAGRASLDYSGNSGFLTPASPAGISPADALTVLAWVRISSISSTQMIVDRSGASQGFALRLTSSGAPQAVINGSTATVTAPDSIADGSWHMIAATYDRSLGSLALWVDGEEVANSSYAGVVDYDPDPGMFIGATDGTSDVFNGLLSAVRIYSRALAEEEILQIFAGNG